MNTPKFHKLADFYYYKVHGKVNLKADREKNPSMGRGGGLTTTVFFFKVIRVVRTICFFSMGVRSSISKDTFSHL